MFKSLTRLAFLVLVTAHFTGCGGGGGSDGAASSTAPTYTVTYEGNGSTGGSVPADTNKYAAGKTVTVLGNTGNLAKTGFSFAGWNTQADGNGTTYTPAQTFAMGSANVTLYAKWTTNPTYTVTYNGNGNTGGTIPTDAVHYETGQMASVLNNSGSLVKTGNDFAGWNTQADGSGTTYAASQTFAMGTANVTLYALWTANQLDPTFDGDGKVVDLTPNISKSASDVAVQTDGKILVAGNSTGPFLTRYNTDGTLDTTFGSSGSRDFSGVLAGKVTAIAIQPSDQKIVVAGYGDSGDLIVGRLAANGDPDMSFGLGSYQGIDLGTAYDTATAVTIQPDGGIVVVGFTGTNPDGNGVIAEDIALARLDANGALDTSFGTGGMVITGLAGSSDAAYAVAIQPDGAIVVAGSSEVNGTGNLDIVLLRYNSDGTLDNTFGTSGYGYVTTDLGAFEAGMSVVIQPSDNKIVVAGYSEMNGYAFVLARYNTDGSPDSNFGDTGVVTTAIKPFYNFALDLAIQSDGKLVAAGSVGDVDSITSSLTNQDFALARYNTNGTLDTTFGGDGMVVTDFGGESEAQAIAIKADGKIVAAGRVVTSGDSDVAIAVYTP